MVGLVRRTKDETKTGSKTIRSIAVLIQLSECIREMYRRDVSNVGLIDLESIIWAGFSI